jgi:hypothetical protein
MYAVFFFIQLLRLLSNLVPCVCTFYRSIVHRCYGEIMILLETKYVQRLITALIINIVIIIIIVVTYKRASCS